METAKQRIRYSIYGCLFAIVFIRFTVAPVVPDTAVNLALFLGGWMGLMLLVHAILDFITWHQDRY